MTFLSLILDYSETLIELIEFHVTVNLRKYQDILIPFGIGVETQEWDWDA